MKTVTVVVVDDSVTVRAVLKRILHNTAGIEVIGEAADGGEAVEVTRRLRPDVVVMDLDLPTMDGVTASGKIMEVCPTNIVVVTSAGHPEKVVAAFESMQRGLVGIFAKPSVPDGWSQLSRDLQETIQQVGARRGLPKRDLVGTSQAVPVVLRPLVVAIGASTGGPGALCELLRELGRGFPAGVAVVQHISEGFEKGLFDWLAKELHIDVGAAEHGAVLQPGTVRVAPPGAHLRFRDGNVLELDRDTAPVRGHRPAADVLFQSLVGQSPDRVAAVLLSGMGSDGAEGMLELYRAGALTVVQDEDSCVVFGMPRAALELGAAELTMAPTEIGRLLALAMRGGSP